MLVVVDGFLVGLLVKPADDCLLPSVAWTLTQLLNPPIFSPELIMKLLSLYPAFSPSRAEYSFSAGSGKSDPPDFSSSIDCHTVLVGFCCLLRMKSTRSERRKSQRLPILLAGTRPARAHRRRTSGFIRRKTAASFKSIVSIGFFLVPLNKNGSAGW